MHDQVKKGEKMHLLIEIHYISNDNKVMRRGSFLLKGKKPEDVAYEWFRQIRREMPFGAELEKIFVDGVDITEKVKELE